MQRQEALRFMRKVQEILQADFTPELALEILSVMWGTASETQKQNWRKNNFQSSVIKDQSSVMKEASAHQTSLPQRMNS